MKIIIGILLTIITCDFCHSWSAPHVSSTQAIEYPDKLSAQRSSSGGATPRKSCFSCISPVSSIFGLCCCFLAFPFLANANPIDQFSKASSSSPVFTQEQLIQSLTPPTDERPQIRPPDKSLLSQQPLDPKTTPIMEGMVYLLDSDDRPNINDVIVITMASMSDPENILAGAKFPVYKARLPFNFEMKFANVIKGKESLYSMAMDKDLLIDVRVCPEDALHIPCLKEESTFVAKGVSKLITLPGMKEEDEKIIVRTAAALPLTRNNRMASSSP